MRQVRTLRSCIAVTLLVMLSAALGGCAAYNARQKCGSAGCPGDADITAKVQAALNQHRELAAPNRIYVKTLDGVVYLSGQVATDLQRDTAAAAAHSVVGAHQVVNSIALTYSGR